ncbi:2-hydroxychromene-2-carboxylate isomerase [Salipiger mucosus]|uniref:2-hydroxychromene-2-carboxylate isomerase n=1 Tax=Salipiger mucosus DSM 16094 TaxID=1123237 RepID=S9RQS9_9RHOB|nr:2-hydroxychromene-2-carboxylate isomerase [Salipiger mucosus]EPX80415.1 2-hydroxychromene-2-carboxylate isomerase [Salipiger mucosus DSM 16094]
MVIEFWFSIGSTYSYLTVMRIEDVAQEAGAEVRWRPFDVRHVMVTQNNVPFKDKPVKAAYMWRDIERRAPRYGLSPRLPAPYPLAELVFANRVATLGAQQGWVADYTRATYRRWFEAGQPAGEEPNLSESLAEIGLDPETVIREAGTPDIEARLQEATAEAMDLGVFGAPSFVVGEEVFWGDDRLEDALDWARRGRLDQARHGGGARPPGLSR